MTGDGWDGRYLSVMTFRADGTASACPVWFVRTGDEVEFRTFTGTLKARRLARDVRIGIAPCDRDGVPAGPYLHGTARRLTGRAARRAGRRLTRRQGWVKPMADLWYRPRLGRTVAFAVDLSACR